MPWVQVVPILRAGTVLLEQVGTVLPVTQTYHVGYVRNDETLEVGGCYCQFLMHFSNSVAGNGWVTTFIYLLRNVCGGAMVSWL